MTKTLAPDFSESHQRNNLTLLRKMRDVKILELSEGNTSKYAIIEANEKKSIIYLALQTWVITNVVNRMFYNYQHIKVK